MFSILNPKWRNIDNVILANLSPVVLRMPAKRESERQSGTGNEGESEREHRAEEEES